MKLSELWRMKSEAEKHRIPGSCNFFLRHCRIDDITRNDILSGMCAKNNQRKILDIIWNSEFLQRHRGTY